MDYYIDKFERVVDLLRMTGAYTAAVVSGSTYEVTSDVVTGLAVKDYLTLGSMKVRVTSIISNKIFRVEAFDQVIVANGTWKALAPYSYYGTRKTLNHMMLEKNGGEYAYQKYPLIALRLPANINIVDDVYTMDADILIATFTSKTLKPHERIANTFKPVLYPLVARFLDMVKRSGEFTNFNSNFNQVDRLFYGVESGDEQNIANVFSDPLDAVELKGLKLTYMLEGVCV